MDYQSSHELTEAINEAKAGDAQAVTRLYREFNPGLLRFLKGRVGHEGEDIASEVWLTIAKNISSFEGNDRDFRAWIFSTARRRTIDHIRRISARPRLSGYEDFEDLASRFHAPESSDQLEIDEAVRTLVSGLSDEQAEVLLLRVVGGLSAEEVAKIINKAEGAVRTIQHRAVKQLSNKFSRKSVTSSDHATFSKEL